MNHDYDVKKSVELISWAISLCTCWLIVHNSSFWTFGLQYFSFFFSLHFSSTLSSLGKSLSQLSNNWVNFIFSFPQSNTLLWQVSQCWDNLEEALSVLFFLFTDLMRQKFTNVFCSRWNLSPEYPSPLERTNTPITWVWDLREERLPLHIGLEQEAPKFFSSY